MSDMDNNDKPLCYRCQMGPAQLTLDLRVVSRHMAEFVSLRCAPDLLVSGVFPNAKEITESQAAFHAVWSYMKHREGGCGQLDNQDIVLWDVACGSSPRTAALFAHRTAWDCCAIDPNLHAEKWAGKFRRVSVHPCKVEEYPSVWGTRVTTTLGGGGGTTRIFPPLGIVTMVHSHVDIPTTLRTIRAERLLVVAIPCCRDLRLHGRRPDREYEDYGCWSPERTILLYDLSDRDQRNIMAEEIRRGGKNG